ncbi:transcription initiation factor IIB [Halanaeroarchaeum sulfurireducens]|uniref:Transcription initiation factor IIB n=1 Tax=Halanaeroarchaeum sulfurireducens TaxID=1604004 RepID=A0A0F7P8I6_9EURY|nr:hypothetical protein [Halanaeroarchaeum sulfurireducens]AKH96535.1 transcription initiation factor TFB [Halanaeroarchaeum sulfurireducens]ALG80937.1 transcription initiation factor TFB [Halanaeroarchaeum sulfurireducens]
MSDRDLKEETRVRYLKRALNEADHLADKLDLPREVRTIATAIFRRARQEELLPGRGVEEVVAAALYIGCKQEGVPRSPDDFARYSDYERKYLLRTAKYLESELGLDLEPFNPKPYVDRFVEQAHLSECIADEAKEIIDYCAKQGLFSGRSPTGIAAAAVYLASVNTKEKVRQKDLAEIADVTEVTIRKRYQEQEEALPDDWGSN